MKLQDTDSAASYAIQLARLKGLAELGPDQLLLGCLLALSRFGVVQLGPWTIDLEELGIDWLRAEWLPGIKPEGPKVAYSEEVVTIFDCAARIARVDGCAEIALEHLLVAFASEDTGLMGELKRRFGIRSESWRAAAASLPRPLWTAPAASGGAKPDPATGRDYFTPEEAAEALGIHVQTLRAYVRSGKMPALRLAGERSIRIRRADLDKVLEPLVPEKP